VFARLATPSLTFKTFQRMSASTDFVCKRRVVLKTPKLFKKSAKYIEKFWQIRKTSNQKSEKLYNIFKKNQKKFKRKETNKHQQNSTSIKQILKKHRKS
jgi:hypothetical protein